jgi:hypothetical protein
MSKPTADVLLDRLLTKANSQKVNWINGPLETVTAAHRGATTNFEKTMAAQKAVDDMQAEILITVMIVAGGAALSLAPSAAVLFGTAGTSAFSRLGARVAQNFPTAVNVAQTFSNHTVVKYIWQGLSKETSTFLKKQVTETGKKQLTDGLQSTNVTGASAEHLLSILKVQTVKIYMHIEDCIRAVIAGNGTEKEKLAFAEQTAKSPFMKDVPVQEVEKLRMVMERRFELIMYMNLILEADSLITTTLVQTPRGAMPRYDHTPIQTRPLDAGYPEKGNISYKDTGNTVARRINTLIAEEQKYMNGKSGSKFMDDETIFSSTVNAKVMRAADTEARRLMALNDLAALIPMSQKF